MDNMHNRLHLEKKTLLEYLYLDIISSSRLAVFLELSENCSLLGTGNVQGQISEHISAPSGGYCNIIFALREKNLVLNDRDNRVFMSRNRQPDTATPINFFLVSFIRLIKIMRNFEVTLQQQFISNLEIQTDIM